MAATPELLVVSGARRGARVTVTRPLVLGRDEDTDLHLPDRGVSGRHCRLTPDEEGVRLQDLGSKNGTYVNGDRVEEATLKPGDEIALGDAIVVFDGQVDFMVARYGEAAAVVLGEPIPGLPPDSSPVQGGLALAAVASLAAALARAAGPEACAESLVDALRTSVEADRVLVIGWNEVSSRAILVTGSPENGAGPAISGTLLRWVAQRRRLIRLDDAMSDERLRKAPSVLAGRLRSVAVAPVLAGDDLHGFLYAERGERRPFEDADASLLEALAAVVGLHGLLRMHPFPSPNARGEHTVKPPGVSPNWIRALETAERVAGKKTALLVTGETGTGKEILARYVHGCSARAGKPFVAVNCGAIPGALAESELFGHEKGSFTGADRRHIGKVEAADGGTLFLDEIGELPAQLQVKLLRVLDTRTFERVGSTQVRQVDLQVIAATHRNLAREIQAGRFRDDLFYRLNAISIHLLPLRERSEDVDPVARALLPRICEEVRVRNPGFDPRAIAELSRHAWPGNVRELANTLERVLILRSDSHGGPISAAEIRAALAPVDPARGRVASVEETRESGATLTLREACEPTERAAIERALRAAGGNKTQAAKLLAISKPTLLKKMDDLGMRSSGEPR